MRTYRLVWSAVMAAAAVVAAVAAGPEVGWLAVALTAASVAGLGAVFAGALASRPQRWTTVRRTAAWCAVSYVLLVGLPLVIGPWAVAGLVGLAALSPPLVARVVPGRRSGPPEAIAAASEQPTQCELRRRWERTTAEVGDPTRPPADVLRLVEERARLLDELEHSDPEWLTAWLTGAGWPTLKDV